tara:strand:- start:410 stop:1000 length:591 start_codon:yes stop_codon:yes gene_type:complete
LKELNSLTKPTTGVGTVILDLESNGLLNNASRIHCVALHFCDDELTEAYNDEKISTDAKYLPMGNRSITTAITTIETADTVVGHNIIGFDLPLIKRLYPFFTYPPVIIDTLLLSRLYHPNLYDIDKKQEWKDMPTKLYGSHSLEAYGYRLGLHKGDFGKDTDWQEWSKEMQDYCIQDVKVTEKLCEHFRPYLSGLR